MTELKKESQTLNTLGKSMLITITGVSIIAASALAADMGTVTPIKAVSDTTTLNPADANISKDEAVERRSQHIPSPK
ncbi:hypothetical protein [Paenibacillus qinlingensis]|uniref:hypothetical protein n=1 Tax=Paenibacillus qinlingensis TaxID=1837343 RepID=UPI0015668154|nr:hypothetical protein [Paenibacillus qinlingensis]NQX61155.1 hypothetical protein [Paenibacillus qinlingensis]